MTCLTCRHGALRDRVDVQRDKNLRGMASRGFINCLKSQARATFMPLTSTCERHVPADAETTTARQAWAARNIT